MPGTGPGIAGDTIVSPHPQRTYTLMAEDKVTIHKQTYTGC